MVFVKVIDGRSPLVIGRNQYDDPRFNHRDDDHFTFYALEDVIPFIENGHIICIVNPSGPIRHCRNAVYESRELEVTEMKDLHALATWTWLVDNGVDIFHRMQALEWAVAMGAFDVLKYLRLHHRRPPIELEQARLLAIEHEQMEIAEYLGTRVYPIAGMDEANDE